MRQRLGVGAQGAAIGVLYPVVIEEGGGLVSSMWRAWRLMRGVRWKLTGLLLLYVIALTILSVSRSARAGPAALVTDLLSWAVDALWSVVIAASYLELRQVSEGAPHDQTAQMFA
jgi:hypothetical protein